MADDESHCGAAAPRMPAEVSSLHLPLGSRVLVMSDLFLGPDATDASLSATREVAVALGGFEGPAAAIFAGNLFDLVGNDSTDAEAALAAHPDVEPAIARFLSGAPNRHVIVLPGNRDRAMLLDPKVRATVEGHGATITLALDLKLETVNGTRLVHVDPGWRWDERNAFVDPYNPADTPLGYHVVNEVFPRIRSARSSWLAGIDRLADQTSLPRFVGSRFIYRRVARFLWWLLIPVAAALVVRLTYLWAATQHGRTHNITSLLLIGAGTLIGEILVVGAALLYLNHRAWRSVGEPMLGLPGIRANDAARDAARELVAGGAAGLITGHTLQAELTHLEGGFYACTGACAEVVTEHRSRLLLPPVFLHKRQVSWVEMEAGAEVHARVMQAGIDLPAGTFLERVASGKRKRTEHEPAVVASYPTGPSWPPVSDPGRKHRRVRRIAATAVALLGLADLIDAVVPPLVRGRLHPLMHYVPLGVSETAGALVALAGVGLLALARGVRRGQRLAWLIVVGILIGTAILHLVDGGSPVQSLAELVLAGYLLMYRECFASRFDLPSLRHGLLTLVIGAAGVTLLAAVVLEATLPFSKHHPPISFWTALWASAGRLAGFETVALPHVVDVFLDPALLAAGIGLVAVALVLAFRPVVDRAKHLRPEDAHARARDIVARHGSGTLDYFALRSDKQWFFDRDGLVAYAIYGGVCLVSPDPIGPVEERERTWTAFRRFADRNGWTMAVLGASEQWLQVYRRSGMRDLYVGDEAVVDVRTFSLAGGTHKGLRQAVNRIAKYGYTISFHDPATVSTELAAELRDVMGKSRRGDVERGFSMTLGRIFDAEDRGLLLAVAKDPDGNAVAFCQYVPAPGIDGYSLDLMRRDDGDHPNGLFDFILVRTIEKLREEGHAHLGLNFATMRAVLAGESGDGLTQRVERWLLRRMSDSMQIESLWRFNAKFDPEWFARYVVWDSAEHSLPTAVAIARAESFWELPIIGRFLVPSAAGDAAGQEPACPDAEKSEVASGATKVSPP
jgi:lysylphosphatidylglycerol synthetase-like protein (DUF2156 family)